MLLQFVKVPVRAAGSNLCCTLPPTGANGDTKSTARANCRSIHSSTLAVDHGSQLVGAWTAGGRDCRPAFCSSLIPYDKEMLERLLMRRRDNQCKHSSQTQPL